MDIRKGNDVNVYFELSKIGVPSAESVKGIRCFFAKDVRSESGDVPVPPSCNPSSYVIHDHMHPGYNVHMPYRSITLHVHREFCVPDNCPPGWHGQTVFVVTDYKIVNIEKEGETVPYLRVAFGGDKQRNGRYNIVLEIVYVGTDDQGHSDVKCTYDYGHQFDLTDQITALSGRIDIWLTDQKDIYTKVEELENDLVQEISRSTLYDEHVETAILGIHGSIDDLQDETEDLYGKYSDQEDEIGELQDRATELENVVPQEASDLNKLADKDYVNQHISENSATFRGTSAKNLTEQQFLSWANTLEKENNDYVFWDTVDGDSDAIFKRYKYNGQLWLYEYTITSNNFTPTQWSAINSGLTSTDKQSLESLKNRFVNLDDYLSQGAILPAAGIYMYGGVNVPPMDYVYVDSQSNIVQYRIFKFEESESGDDTGYIVYQLTNVATNTYTCLGIYSATDSNVPYGVKEAFHDNIASASYDGLMSKEDKQKIDELPNNVDLEVQIDNKTINWFTVNNDNGVKITVGQNDMDSNSRLSALIPNASNIKAGVMSAEDKGKLDGIISRVSVDEYDNVTLSANNLITLNSGTDITLFAGGGNDVKIESDGGDIILKINSTTLTLDETKLQRLAQLLA